MAANDEDESTAVIVGVLAGIVLAVVAVVYGASAGKAVKPKAAPVVAAQVAEEPEIAPVGEALVMTAAGLAVAIPAVLAYNLFGKWVAGCEAELEGFAHDLREL